MDGDYETWAEKFRTIISRMNCIRRWWCGRRRTTRTIGGWDRSEWWQGNRSQQHIEGRVQTSSPHQDYPSNTTTTFSLTIPRMHIFILPHSLLNIDINQRVWPQDFRIVFVTPWKHEQHKNVDLPRHEPSESVGVSTVQSSQSSEPQVVWQTLQTLQGIPGWSLSRRIRKPWSLRLEQDASMKRW